MQATRSRNFKWLVLSRKQQIQSPTHAPHIKWLFPTAPHVRFPAVNEGVDLRTAVASVVKPFVPPTYSASRCSAIGVLSQPAYLPACHHRRLSCRQTLHRLMQFQVVKLIAQRAVVHAIQPTAIKVGSSTLLATSHST
jgi:hypothetical protein